MIAAAVDCYQVQLLLCGAELLVESGVEERRSTGTRRAFGYLAAPYDIRPANIGRLQSESLCF